MLSIGLWRWNNNITITIVDIIHRPAFYLKHDVSDTGFCLRLQVEPTHVGPIDRASVWPRKPATTRIVFIKSTQAVNESWHFPHLESPRIWKLRPRVFKLKMVKMFTLIGGLCCWLYKAYWCCCWCISIGPNCAGSTWRRRKSPVSATSCFKWKTRRL
jgi:hypothetical protein